MNVTEHGIIAPSITERNGEMGIMKRIVKFSLCLMIGHDYERLVTLNKRKPRRPSGPIGALIDRSLNAYQCGRCGAIRVVRKIT